MFCVQSITKQVQESGSPHHLLTELSQHLKETLSQWFTPQLLDVCQVTWQSPCDLLEKISTYEAVHPLRHWKDLKHRLGVNRRCFVFMHKAIPQEPLMILHVALTRQPASSIHVREVVFMEGEGGVGGGGGEARSPPPPQATTEYLFCRLLM